MKTVEKSRKVAEKSRGTPSKLLISQFGKCHIVPKKVSEYDQEIHNHKLQTNHTEPKLVLNECLDTACLSNDQIHKHQISFLINIDENIRT